MSELNKLSIEVAYALPHTQTLLSFEVDVGTSIQDAIAQSGIFDRHPELKEQKLSTGIWSRVVKPNYELQDGDRIEIYRPLIADPKEVRKRRAEKAIEEGRADKVTGGRVNKQRASN